MPIRETTEATFVSSALKGPVPNNFRAGNPPDGRLLRVLIELERTMFACGGIGCDNAPFVTKKLG
jgi:hypothetical protein